MEGETEPGRKKVGMQCLMISETERTDVYKRQDICLNEEKLVYVDTFKYPGTCITSDGICTTDIKLTIGQATRAFFRNVCLLGYVVQDVSLETEKKSFAWYV